MPPGYAPSKCCLVRLCPVGSAHRASKGADAVRTKLQRETLSYDGGVINYAQGVGRL